MRSILSSLIILLVMMTQEIPSRESSCQLQACMCKCPLFVWLVQGARGHLLLRRLKLDQGKCLLYRIAGCPLLRGFECIEVYGNLDIQNCLLYRKCPPSRGVR